MIEINFNMINTISNLKLAILLYYILNMNLGIIVKDF